MDEIQHFSVDVSDLAYEMLEAHQNYLSKFDVDSPDKLADEFAEIITGLETWPRRYSRVYADDETMGELRKAWFYHNRYAVIFRIVDDRVIIEYVIDGKQENAWLFDL